MVEKLNVRFLFDPSTWQEFESFQKHNLIKVLQVNLQKLYMLLCLETTTLSIETMAMGRVV